jgi:2'-5' RNA ligase
MGGKTHMAAVVLIPPEQLWAPVQEIRRRHDRQFRRWMPHVTLLYPFRPREDFDALAGPLEEAARTVQPFDVELAEFRWFSHGRRSFTVWLAPEPAVRIGLLQEALWRVVPDCDDVRQFAGGFTPHLSVGQVRDRQQLKELLAALRSAWRPLRFRVESVSLIWRRRPPDDVFRVDRSIRLG